MSLLVKDNLLRRNDFSTVIHDFYVGKHYVHNNFPFVMRKFKKFKSQKNKGKNHTFCTPTPDFFLSDAPETMH